MHTPIGTPHGSAFVSKICVPAALPTLPGRHFVKLDVTRGAVLMASITVSCTHAVAHACFIHGHIPTNRKWVVFKQVTTLPI